MKCMKCDNSLTNDDIGLHKKFINRNANEFMCINCLSEYFKVPVPILEQKIAQFRNMGCMLFP